MAELEQVKFLLFYWDVLVLGFAGDGGISIGRVLNLILGYNQLLNSIFYFFIFVDDCLIPLELFFNDNIFSSLNHGKIFKLVNGKR